MQKYILASASPRRVELLKEIVPEYDVLPSNTLERTDKIEPKEIVADLAQSKARNVLDRTIAQSPIVIGADTIVVYNGVILGKPKDNNDAIRMLTLLSGQTHQVYTGMCIMSKDKTDVFVDKSDVTFHPLTEEQIVDYVGTSSPLDKAGAYGIQDSGFVKEIRGSYTCVMGLGMELLKQHLEKFTEGK